MNIALPVSHSSETAPTASEMLRSETSFALTVAFRELELFDTGDVEGANEVFSSDVIDHNPADSEVSGFDGMTSLITTVRDGFTDTQHRILFHAELPGGWVVVHWRMTATHTGDAFGFAGTGTPVALNGCDIMRIAGGKVAEIYHVEQMLQLTQQLAAAAER